MAYESIRRKGWSDTVENQCHLLYAICADILTCEIKNICKLENLSEEEGWSIYGLKTVKQVLNQGTVWDSMFLVIRALDVEYKVKVTKHFKRLKENYLATTAFLKDLRQSPEVSKYQPVFYFFSHWQKE